MLEPLGARYVVVSSRLDERRQNRADIIRRLDVEYAHHLRPLEKSGDVWLYEIIGWPR